MAAASCFGEHCCKSMHLALEVVWCYVMSHDCQIPERLKLTLELLKRELAVATLQQKLGKEVCDGLILCGVLSTLLSVGRGKGE